MTGVADASNSIEQAKHGGDHSSRAAQLLARENEQKALSLWIKGATFQRIAARAPEGKRVGIISSFLPSSSKSRITRLRPPIAVSSGNHWTLTSPRSSRARVAM